ncbi:2OG-Fe dioxygenase family protein [Bradyrhizobium sp. SSUT77]|uniref:2OG-Fe dioxygenase family protein n=1 Tax=Bradyrhizobium sp. SSUT77 TaxID=3040603 RepID=UPI00244BEE0A|nr:2OG-Fe dioxygenase family protein [Bradyrhizobium sp. SSUT77]MDH2343603.1 2OG-Fe dioxygenase family protein [Bradyrhizobium sp. SSUT77]
MTTKLTRKFDILEPGSLLTDFSPLFENLGPDVYHPAQTGGRSRRLAQHYATFDPKTGKISVTRLVTQPFLQGDYNKLTGHLERPIEPTLPDTDLSRFIEYGFKSIQERWPLDGRENEWLVNCHLIRTHAKGKQEGVPVPEGIHRDGVDYLIMGSVRRQDVSGGVSYIYDHVDGDPFFETTLTPGQAILIDDESLFHMASPVTATKDEGHRDMILMGFHFWSRNHYRFDWKDHIYAGSREEALVSE